MSVIPSFNDPTRRDITNRIVNIIKEHKITFSKNKPQRNWLISFTAPNGWGKTRIIQEVYKRLSCDSEFNDLPVNRKLNGQKHDLRFSGYWPVSFFERAEHNDNFLEASRKAISPPIVEKETKTLPAFMWIGVNCQHNPGLESLLFAFENHKDYLYDSAFFTTSDLEAWFRNLQEFSSEGVKDNLIGKASELALSIGDVALGGTVSAMLKKAKSLFDEDKERSNRLRSKKPSSEKVKSSLIESIGSIASAGIPFVICIEDLHLAKTELIDCLTKLLDGNFPVVIITTQTSEVDWHEKNKSRNFLRLRYSHLSSDDSEIFEPLPTSAIASIVKQYFPNTADKDAEMIAGKYNNPLICQALLELRKVKRFAKTNDNAITFELVNNIPPTLEDIYGNYFKELNEETQNLLVILAKLTNCRGKKWTKLLQNYVCGSLDEIHGKGAYQDIMQNWCLQTREETYTFYSDVHESLCLRYAKENLDEEDISQITELLVKKIASEPLDALNEGTVSLVDKILRDILQSKPEFSYDLVAACVAILKFGVQREAEYERIATEIYSMFNATPSDIAGFEYSRGAYDLPLFSYWNFLLFLKKNAANHNHRLITQVVTEADISLTPNKGFSLSETDDVIFNKAYEQECYDLKNNENGEHFEFRFYPDIDFDEMTLALGCTTTDVEKGLANIILKEALEHWTGNTDVNLVTSALWCLYDELPDRVKKSKDFEPLIQNIEKRVEHINNVRQISKLTARRNMETEALRKIPALRKEREEVIERFRNKLKDKSKVTRKLKLASIIMDLDFTELDEWERVLENLGTKK